MSEFLTFNRQIIAKRIIRRIYKRTDYIAIETDDDFITFNAKQVNNDLDGAMLYLLRCFNAESEE